MPVDIKTVDPAIVKAESKQDRSRPKPQGPSFVSLIQGLTKTDDGFLPAVNFDNAVVVHTSDDKYYSVPRAIATKTPIKLGEQTATVEFPYTADALATIVHWCDKYGADGKSESTFVFPVTHTDLNVLLSSEWEKLFNTNVIARHDGTDVLASSIIAAEGLGMQGLLDFLVVALGCAIRGKSDHDILGALHESKSIEDEEIAAAKQKYQWLESAATPSV